MSEAPIGPGEYSEYLQLLSERIAAAYEPWAEINALLSRSLADARDEHIALIDRHTEILRAFAAAFGPGPSAARVARVAALRDRVAEEHRRARRVMRRIERVREDLEAVRSAMRNDDASDEGPGFVS